jgi:hypothetical protein
VSLLVLQSQLTSGFTWENNGSRRTITAGIHRLQVFPLFVAVAKTALE